MRFTPKFLAGLRGPIGLFAGLLVFAAHVPLAHAADPYAPDTPEAGSVEKIREFTTDDQYLPPSVSYVPQSQTVPSPTQVLGHLVGAPNELSRVADVHGYFKRLGETSPHVRVQVIGESEEGREMLLVTVAASRTLENIDRYRHITRRLADPRTTTREQMEQLVGEGKPIYYLLGGLHSPETGSPEMLMELAYRLAVSEKREIKAIRENLIVLITPICEPDGRDRIVDWYYRHLRGRGLPWEEITKFRSPPYWGHYAFHDNNRDGMQLTLALTRAIHGAYYDYHPQVVHDLHESLPLLYISTGHGPYSLAIDPLTINEWTQFAHHEAGGLQAQDLPGVWVWGFWDGWWPGYLFSVANNHNSIGRFYETFGNTAAETFERDTEYRKFVGKKVTEPQWYRPWPPEKKVRWSLRNNTNYMQAGVLKALDYAVQHRAELLKNFWIKGQRALEKGRTEAPYAWVFGEQQRDQNRLSYLINLLGKHRIDVHRLTEDFEHDGRKYKAGSYLVRMDQPYRNAAVNFLERQTFPKDEPNPPYDDVAWTWPLLFGVEGEQLDDDAILSAPMAKIESGVHHSGAVDGAGPVYLLQDTGQNALLAARVKLGAASVEAADQPFVIHGTHYPAGSWIVRRAPNIEAVAAEYGLDFESIDEPPNIERHLVDLPRLAVLHTWISTQACGWVRYTLDQEGVPYTLINPEDVKRGGLNRRFDVILFPHSRGELKNMVHGVDPEFGPLAYTKTKAFPSHGVPNSSPDITAGMGFKGLANLEQFIQSGGLLVAIGGAGVLPVDGGLVRRVNKASVGSTPGSEVQAKVLRTDHPLVYGYTEMPTVFRGNVTAFDVAEHDRNLVVMQFGTKKFGDDAQASSGNRTRGAKPDKKPLLLSGYIEKPDKLDGVPAILDVPTGQGRVVLYSFNPLHRYLNHSDFRFVYNVILHWNDLPSGTNGQRRGGAAVAKRKGERK